MLQESPMEHSFANPNHLIAPAEVYFDELIAHANFDGAEAFIADYVNDLKTSCETKGYTSKFFRASLKQLALPMYHKLHADATGEPFYGANVAISGMFNQASALMRQLDDFEDQNTYFNDVAVGESSYLSDLRGDRSELIVFAVMSADLTGYGDDFSIMPSAVRDDVSSRGASGRLRGYDFLVHDRDEDVITKLQVKSGGLHDGEYEEDIKIVSVTSLARQSATSVVGLQAAIASGNRSHQAIKNANLTLRTMLK
jgi:hypothetical protein